MNRCNDALEADCFETTIGKSFCVLSSQVLAVLPCGAPCMGLLCHHTFKQVTRVDLDLYSRICVAEPGCSLLGVMARAGPGTKFPIGNVVSRRRFPASAFLRLPWRLPCDAFQPDRVSQRRGFQLPCPPAGSTSTGPRGTGQVSAHHRPSCLESEASRLGPSTKLSSHSDTPKLSKTTSLPIASIKTLKRAHTFRHMYVVTCWMSPIVCVSFLVEIGPKTARRPHAVLPRSTAAPAASFCRQNLAPMI
jgi:hypothetical protein